MVGRLDNSGAGGANEQEKEPGPLKRKYECDEPGRECTNLTGIDNHKRRDHGAEKLKCQDSNCAALFVRRIGLLFLITCGLNMALAKDLNVRNVERGNLPLTT